MPTAATVSQHVVGVPFRVPANPPSAQVATPRRLLENLDTFTLCQCLTFLTCLSSKLIAFVSVLVKSLKATSESGCAAVSLWFGHAPIILIEHRKPF